jgi:hypothetical protein
MRIQWTRLTVKALQKRLQQAYSAGDKRLVRRLSVLLAVGQHRAKVTEVAQQWQLSPATIYYLPVAARLPGGTLGQFALSLESRSSTQADKQAETTLVPTAG